MYSFGFLNTLADCRQLLILTLVCFYPSVISLDINFLDDWQAETVSVPASFEAVKDFWLQKHQYRLNDLSTLSNFRQDDEIGSRCGILDSCILRCGDELSGLPYICSCDSRCQWYKDCCHDAAKYCPREQYFGQAQAQDEDPGQRSRTCKASDHLFHPYGFLHWNEHNLKRICTTEEPPWCEAESQKGIPRPSLSLLLNFGPPGWNNHLLMSQDYKQRDLCPDPWEIWDPFSDICRPIQCGPDFVEENGKCKWDGEGSPPSTDDIFRYETTQIKVTITGMILSASADCLLLKNIQEQFLPSLAIKTGVNASRFVDLSVAKITDDEESVNDPTEILDSCSELSGNSNIFKNLENEIIISDEGIPVEMNFTILKRLPDDDLDDLTVYELEMEDILSILNEAVSKETILQLIDSPDQYIRLTGIQRWLDREEHYFFEKWCRGGDLEYYWNEDFEVSFFYLNETETANETVVMRLFVKPRDKWYEEGEYISNILYQSSDMSATETNVSGVVVVCENRPYISDSSCPRVGLNESDFKPSDTEPKVLHYIGEIRGIKLVLNMTDYYFDSIGLIVVCIDVWAAKGYELIGPTLAEDIAAWLSFILTLLSLTALVITILVYIGLPDLRTLPGWCLVHFCIADATFFGLFLFGINSGTVTVDPEDFDIHVDPHCFIIAALLHYSAILLFTWSAIISWDLYQTFTKFQIAAQSNTKRQLRRYVMIGYGIPAIIVFTALMLDSHTTTTFKPDYGSNGLCWIGNSMVALYFFAIPIGISVLGNFTLFGCTVSAIRKTSSFAAQVGLREKRNRFKLFSRMSSVMCFGWIFGFLTVGFQWDKDTSRVFEFIFIVVNSLQGVYVFWAFVMNGRVKGLLWAKLGWSVGRSTSTMEQSSNAHESTVRRKVKVSSRDDMKPWRNTSAATVGRSVSNETCMSNLSSESGSSALSKF